MADLKISQLTDGGGVQAADDLVANRGGSSYKVRSAGVDGWVDSTAETWTYASVDGPTFTFTVSGDLTAKYTPGTRLKLTQTTVKYFIVTAVSVTSGTTTVTIYGGTDYTLANAAISANNYSRVKAPAGFPLDPTKWTEQLVDTTSRSQSSPTANTWYNLGSLSLVIPIGAWHVSFFVEAYSTSTGNFVSQQTALSTSSSSVSDNQLQAFSWKRDSSTGGSNDIMQTQHAAKDVVLAAKATYLLIARTTESSGGSINFRAAESMTLIRAICAYL